MKKTSYDVIGIFIGEWLPKCMPKAKFYELTVVSFLQSVGFAEKVMYIKV